MIGFITITLNFCVSFNNFKNYPLTFVGSVAYFLSDYINEIAKKEGMQIQEIVQSPIDNLVSDHFIKHKNRSNK